MNPYARPRPSAFARVAIAGALITLGAACSPGQPSGGDRPARPARTVRTAEVARSGETEALVPGVVQARQRASLAARVSASVVELPSREGESVGAGAIVARLEDGALRSAVAAADASVAAAEADFARIDALVGKGAATSRERDEAAARAAASRAALQAARDNLSYAVLRAPFAGVVSARPVHVGDVVSPGTPVVEIEGRSGFEVRATLEPDLAATTTTGAAIQVHVDGQPTSLTATVKALSPAGDPATHRFEIRADLPQADGMRSGTFARLVVPRSSSEPTLSVIKSATFERGGLTGVFVVREGRAFLRWVALGADRDGALEVRAGLTAGERVVVEPAGLADGDPVQEAR